ncbi:MAG: HEPN domain-containing protein [Chloroflexota bacterium]|nr:HEPN domain-containing protein [Chloroflexota bacterium]
MKQATLGWVERAEGDYRAAVVLLSAAQPVSEAACFHAQQCAEKYLKAFLQEHDIRVPHTHDLLNLAQRTAPLAPDLAVLETDLAVLNVYAVEIRYPGAGVEPAQAQAALRTAEAVRRLVRQALGLGEEPR